MNLLADSIVLAMISIGVFMDIFSLARQGLSQRTIARRLGIHRKTVKDQKINLLCRSSYDFQEKNLIANLLVSDSYNNRSGIPIVTI